jgi:hypothetical protein
MPPARGLPWCRSCVDHRSCNRCPALSPPTAASLMCSCISALSRSPAWTHWWLANSSRTTSAPRAMAAQRPSIFDCLRSACALVSARGRRTCRGAADLWLFGFTALKRKKGDRRPLIGSACLERVLVPIRPFLNRQTSDPETVRLLGVAFETDRAAAPPTSLTK